ncbi:GDP-mannose 4,6-dehydratase [Dyella sp. GSA-30]|uniref:GDP-mannose 4,6-dehydratase n=1 Tax=Dyella sp. GSA-30 TaxID=2994496 RepID=UPI0024902361|nr:GDP-mannose 4,6-dehydratase [Dyella sp. GSA-30]BDU20194.1 GDP-6-deoxy-D-mannose reductase [Dyella sp. GSA-30]
MSEGTARRRLLLTGAGGFVGATILDAATRGGFAGWDIVAAPTGMDIRDESTVRDWVASVKPDAALHLAAQSFVPRSFEAPWETFEINLGGTLNLLQALRFSKFAGRVVYVSSGDVYGLVPDGELPVDEHRLPEPRNPYSVSKVAAEQLVLMWHRTYGMDAMVARPFNHIGPGQAVHFAVPSFASQVVAVERGADPVIRTGDIDTTRDFTDVRDVVAAYEALLDKGVAGCTYVIGSGHEYRMRTLIEMMCELAGVKVTLEQDPTRMRLAEQRRMVANAALLHEHTGWEPRIPIKKTLNDVLLDARGRA